jgi:hypothetical protein
MEHVAEANGSTECGVAIAQGASLRALLIATGPPSNLISKVHVSFAGNTVTGLHFIGSMNAASVRFRIIWCFLVFASASWIFLGALI